jgi:putative PIN family toxin of toxin-antitoxin system
MKKYQIILDTNVVYSGLRSKQGGSAKLIRLIESGKFEINISAKLVLEYEDVLKRPGSSQWWSVQEADDFLDFICFVGKRHNIWFLWRPLLSDAKDDFIVELAIKATVDFIVTHNVNDFKNAQEVGVKAINPKEFLQIIGEAK